MMTPKAQVIPGKVTLLQAKVGLVVASLFLLFGIGFGAVVLQETPSSEDGLRLLIGAFFLIWVAVCISVIVIYSRILSNAKNAKDRSLFEVRLEEPDGTAMRQPGDFDIRLRKLEQLKTDGLVSEAEYQQKRSQIMEENW